MNFLVFHCLSQMSHEVSGLREKTRRAPVRTQAFPIECRSTLLLQNILLLKVPKAEENEDMGSRQAFCLLPGLERCAGLAQWEGS